MSLYSWEIGDAPVWSPLERFSLVTARLHGGRLRPDDFMYMGYVWADGLPDIHLYKHIDTRRYLNLDDAGHAYRFFGVVGESLLPSALSCYELWRDAESAIECVDLGLLDDAWRFTPPPPAAATETARRASRPGR